jgi:hypothetical protein
MKDVMSFGVCGLLMLLNIFFTCATASSDVKSNLSTERVVAFFASWSATSFPSMPECAGIHFSRSLHSNSLFRVCNNEANRKPFFHITSMMFTKNVNLDIL